MASEKRTWLIQRLEKPRGNKGLLSGAALNSMAFGGGGSGLSREAMALLSDVFSFDYMGAAEFEFGALPKSLAPFARDAEKLTPFEIAFGPSDYAENWKRRYPRKGDKFPPKKEHTVYVLARAEDRDYATSVIRRCAANEQDLKESSYLADVLDRVEEYPRTCGWYELDNGFFFFTDREMWERTCALFGVSVPAEKAA